MIYPSIHGSEMGMQTYDLGEIYRMSEKEEKILEHIEGIEDIKFLEKYKHHLKPKGFLSSLCFLLNDKLATRYFTVSHRLKKIKKESESLKDKLN